MKNKISVPEIHERVKKNNEYPYKVGAPWIEHGTFRNQLIGMILLLQSAALPAELCPLLSHRMSELFS